MLLRWLRALRGRPEQQAPPPSNDGVFVGPHGTAQPLIGERNPEDWYTVNVWAAIGVQRVAESVAAIPWLVETKRRVGWEVDEEHPLSRLLSFVNDEEDLFLLKEALASWLMLRGSGYLWLGSDGSTAPSVLHWLPSSLVRPQPSDRPPYTKGWAYYANGEGRDPIVYGREQVVQLLRFSPKDSRFGQGDFVACRTELAQYGYAGQFNEQFLRGGGLPAGILKAERQLEEPDEKRVDSWLRRVMSRFGNRKLLVMGKGMEFQEIGSRIDDVVVKSLPTTTREAILAATGTPPSQAGLTERINYATARIQERSMYNAKVIPLDTRMLARINDRVVPLFGSPERLRVVHDLGHIDCLQDDLETRVRAAKEFVLGYLGPPNEARAMFLNLGPRPGGDVILGPISTVVIQDAAGQPNTVEDVTGSAGTDEASRGSGLQTRRSSLDDGTASALESRPTVRSGALDDGTASALESRPTVRSGDGERRAVLHRAYNRTRDSEAGALRRRIASWWDDRADDVMAKIEADGDLARAVRLRQPTVTALLWDVLEATGALEDLIAPALADLYARTGQAELASVDVDVNFDLDNRAARELLRARNEEMATVESTARDAVRACLDEGLANGETAAQLADRVREWARAGREGQAANVARTETGIVMNSAAREADRQAGATGFEWLAIGDDRIRDSHEAMDGVTVAVGERFTLPGGEECEGPGDPGLSAEEVCNCRCTTAAVFGGGHGNS